MRFYDFVHKDFHITQEQEQTFELQAGLVSALYEFSRVLGLPIELLKYRAEEQEEDVLIQTELKDGSDVIVTVRSESFLIASHFRSKINLIYNEIIKNHIPLGPHKRISDSDERFMVDLFNDASALEKIDQNRAQIDDTCQSILEEYGEYGLENIIISSFDGCPLKSYNMSLEMAFNLFRKMRTIPIVKEYQWKYRLIAQKGLYIINSGTGVKIKDLFMPYYYILVTSESAMLGDSPTTIYQKINNVFLEE